MVSQKRNPDLAYCTYELNGESLSQLICEDVSYEAFSGGRPDYVNDARYQSVPEFGPIPVGRYYILDRESGGLLGWIRQPLRDFFAGTDRSDWFSLYRDDDQIDDQTIIDSIRRGEFRIHPVGPRGISQGCVTLISQISFDELKRSLRNRRGEILEGTSIRYYGVLDVFEGKKMVAD